MQACGFGGEVEDAEVHPYTPICYSGKVCRIKTESSSSSFSPEMGFQDFIR